MLGCTEYLRLKNDYLFLERLNLNYIITLDNFELLTRAIMVLRELAEKSEGACSSQHSILSFRS